MAAERIRLQCINKGERCNPHERIISIGGVDGDGSRWKLEQPSAIEGIENGKWRSYVQNPHIVDVIVAVSRFGNKYLKTEANRDPPDNLLSLPECP